MTTSRDTAAGTADTGLGPAEPHQDDATPAPPARTDHRSAGEIEVELRGRLLRPGPTDRLWGWIGPLVVTAIAAVLRLVDLNHPTRLIFDETYYVKQAYSLLVLGYEGEWEADDANDRFKEGDFSDLSTEANYVVHPQIGKWLIAIGLRLFGADNGAGWRFSAAIAGAVTVLILARVTRRLLGSTLLGTAAGLLLALDGLHFTGSRIGLLDVFLGMFVLAGLAAVLLDRERNRRRLARVTAADLAERGDGRLSDPWGPRTGIRWWLVVAGVLLGLGAGVKWSSIYAVAVFGILVVVWDVCARRAVGARLWVGAGAFRGGVPAFLALVPTAAVTYVLGWFSWFASSGGYLRQWAAEQWAEHGTVERMWLPHALNSWWEYHTRMWEFHNGLDSEHSYEAHPAGWIIQLRPTSFYWQSPAPGDPDCGADRCIQAITSVGNPAIWWLGVLALVVVLWAALARRDWRAWTVLAGYAATYLPWFAYSHRTIFTFYAIALAPYVALALVFAVAWVTRMLPPLHGELARSRGQVPGARETLAAALAMVPGRRRAAAGGQPSAGSVVDDDAWAPAPDGSWVSRPDDAAWTSGPGGDARTTRPVGSASRAAGSTHDDALRGDELDGAARSEELVGAAPRTRLGLVVLAVVCLLALAAFVYFWPVWTGQTLPYEWWRDRMWLGRFWI